MTKDEYIAFLESENARYYKEIQQLTYEKGFLRVGFWGYMSATPGWAWKS